MPDARAMALKHDAPHLPPRGGIGLKPRHYDDLLRQGGPSPAWLEAHPENYFAAGGGCHAALSALRERYPLSFHSIGLSLGSLEEPEPSHLQRLKELCRRYRPALVSDHLSWSRLDGVFYPDLLPLPYTDEALRAVCRNIGIVQDALGRQILVENPSTYMTAASIWDEPAFLQAMCAESGCGLLLDLNNVAVSCHNQGWDAAAYLDAVEARHVQEIHLAGHFTRQLPGGDATLRIDDHGSAAPPEVWDLFDRFLQRAGRHVPTLIEWDNNVPSLETLVAQASEADRRLAAVDGIANAA